MSAVADVVDDLVDATVVAKRLGISVKTVPGLCRRREIEFVRVGRLLRFKPAAIAAYVDRQTHAPAMRPGAEPTPAAAPVLSIDDVMPPPSRRRFNH